MRNNLLDDYKKMFVKEAQCLGDYNLLTKNELADGFIKAREAQDESLMNQYWSALMLRYWFKIYKWKENSKSLNLDDEDFIGWLNDALTYAFDHCSWLDPTKAVYNDPNGPDKVINMCCESTRLIWYQHYNKDKRKGNVQTYSIDGGIDENGDCALDMTGCVEEATKEDGAKALIKNYIEKNKYLEALILDGIAYQDAQKEIKSSHIEQYEDQETGELISEKVDDSYSQFDMRKLVKHLNEVNQKFMTNYFNVEYDINDEKSTEILEKLRKTSNPNLYKYIKKTIIEIRDNPNLLELLYN